MMASTVHSKADLNKTVKKPPLLRSVSVDRYSKRKSYPDKAQSTLVTIELRHSRSDDKHLEVCNKTKTTDSQPVPRQTGLRHPFTGTAISSRNTFANVVSTAMQHPLRRNTINGARRERMTRVDTVSTGSSSADSRIRAQRALLKRGLSIDIPFPRSCPNLDKLQAENTVSGIEREITPSVERRRGSPEIDQTENRKTGIQSSKANGSKSSIPNIFITSCSSTNDLSQKPANRPMQRSHSCDQREDIISKALTPPESKIPLSQRASTGSVPNLKNYIHRPISKSASDSLAQKLTKTTEFAMFLTESASKKFKNKPKYTQLCKRLYVGNLECAYNEPLLCKLSIGSVVDLSNVVPDMVPSHKKWGLTCLCGKGYHTQAILRLHLDLTHTHDIEENFEKINKFILGAHRYNKNVLIVCYSGTNVSAVAALQFILSQTGATLEEAQETAKDKLEHVNLDGSVWGLLSKSVKHQREATNTNTIDLPDRKSLDAHDNDAKRDNDQARKEHTKGHPMSLAATENAQIGQIKPVRHAWCAKD